MPENFPFENFLSIWRFSCCKQSSSLGYWDSFPVKTLKYDLSFAKIIDQHISSWFLTPFFSPFFKEIPEICFPDNLYFRDSCHDQWCMVLLSNVVTNFNPLGKPSCFVMIHFGGSCHWGLLVWLMCCCILVFSKCFRAGFGAFSTFKFKVIEGTD